MAMMDSTAEIFQDVSCLQGECSPSMFFQLKNWRMNQNALFDRRGEENLLLLSARLQNRRRTILANPNGDGKVSAVIKIDLSFRN